MSVNLALCFTDAARKYLRLFGVWPPGNVVKVGTYGTLSGSLFSPLGDLNLDFGISYNQIVLDARHNFEFKSDGVSEVIGRITARTPQDIERSSDERDTISSTISFRSGGSVLFRAKDSVYHTISNAGFVNKKIIEKFSDGNWLGHFVFVSGIYRSAGTTIVVSSSDAAEITLNGNGPAGFDIADVNAQISVKNERNLGLKIIAQGNATPLMCISGLRPLNRFLAAFGGRPSNLDVLSTTLVYNPNSFMISDNSVLENEPEISLEQANYIGISPFDLYHVTEL